MDQNLSMTRGDTGSFNLQFVNYDGDLENDMQSMIFTVKENVDSGTAVFQKTLGSGISKVNDSLYVVRIAPTDTEDLGLGFYYYDLQIRINGDAFTVLKGVIEITYDVTTTEQTVIIAPYEELEDIRVGYNGRLYDTAGEAVRGQISDLHNEVDVLDGRMDEFTSLPEGSTAGNAELVDIRVGADGVTYPSAGDAVRGQVEELDDKIDNNTDAIGDIDSDVDVLKARMDVFTSLPDGSTAGDAELQDIRVGANGVLYNSAGDAVRGQIEEVTKKLVRVASNNLLKSDNDFTEGFVDTNGTVHSYSSYQYTRKFSVSEGDVIRSYAKSGGAFGLSAMRVVAAYDSSFTPITASGAESVSSYTVPSGIKYVVLTCYKGYTEYMITKNYIATVYEAYYPPFYVASADFIKDAIEDYDLNPEVVKGYNLLKSGEDGDGYYYASSIGSKIVHGSTSSSYHYAIIPVKQNTMYFVSRLPRFWAFTNDNDIVTAFGENDGSPMPERMYMDSGNGTKFYYSIDSGTWNNESNYGSLYAIQVNEGKYGTYNQVDKPVFISGITQNMMENKYGCALPRDTINFTVGTDEHWYLDNIKGLPENIVLLKLPSNYINHDNDSFHINTPNTTESGQIYAYRVYDSRFACIAQQPLIILNNKADNLQNCSALVIGDSTVAQNYMTADMISDFSAKNKALTLIGTQGTGANKHEGRSGWSAYRYCTTAENNPFYNTGTGKFDFSYYMTNQGYSAPDFVVIQLGINDLYNADFATADTTIENTANYILEMVDSILSYNSSQKILLNLPTALNNDRATHTYHLLEFVRNIFIRYNEFIQLKIASTYSKSKVRCSYCHLILDPNNDISDDVHPTQAGYQKMADEVVNQINCWQN